MTATNKLRIYLTCAGMELSWIYASMALVFTGGKLPLLPLSEIVRIYMAAMFIIWWLRGRGWRIYQVLLVKLVVFALAGLHLIFACGRWSNPTKSFWNVRWLVGLLNIESAPDWLLLIMLGALTVTLWRSGHALVNTSPTPESVAGLFDKGVGLLGMVVFLEALVRIPCRQAYWAIFSFFGFGILALAFSQTRDKVRKRFLPGARTAGVIFFTGGVMAGTALLITMGMPLLAQIAGIGYQGFRRIFAPLAPVLIRLLRIIFGFGYHNLREEAGSPKPAPSPGDLWGSNIGQSWWEKTFQIGMVALEVIVGITLLVIALQYLWSLLNRRNPKGERPLSGRQFWFFWRRWIQIFWRRYRDGFRGGDNDKFDGAVIFYRRLLAWGKRNGLFKLAYETPGEYGERLVKAVSGLGPEIILITQSFNAQFYGALRPDSRKLLLLKKAIGKVRKTHFKKQGGFGKKDSEAGKGKKLTFG